MTDKEINVQGSFAIVTGRINVTGSRNGLYFSNSYRITQSWVLKEGKWKRASYQDAIISKSEGSNHEATESLSFLLGNWEIERIYTPDTQQKRVLQGTLTCKLSMDNSFIQCTYEMQRPGKSRALDVVYFNYNSSYDLYESLWLSSTWPVKVLLQGRLDSTNTGLVLDTDSEFPIENGVIEYVKDELVFENQSKSTPGFIRKTYIRTNQDPEGKWTYWMLEKAEKIH